MDDLISLGKFPAALLRLKMFFGNTSEALMRGSLFYFERGVDPYSDMNMGSKANWINWLKSSGIKYSFFPKSSNELFVNGNIYIDGACFLNKSLQGVNLQKVDGFFILHNTKLTYLEGCPKEVGGSFICINNLELKSLEGCPQVVNKDFVFYNNGIEFPEKGIKIVRKKDSLEIKPILKSKSELKY